MKKKKNKQEQKPERLGRLSMSPLTLEEALSGALKIKPSKKRGGRKSK